jgi:fatty acid-binding protein DegV
VLRIGEARTRNKGIAHFKLMLRRLGKLERLAMLHTNAEQEAQAILDEFSAGLEYPPLLANVTTIIGTHVGANALGFAAVLAE